MTYASAYIIEGLKAAREAKQLSQRALSAKAGVPQSHISKIESGAVDLQLSSLVELARLLDLEVMLVPRALVPAVRGIVRSPEILSAARARATREAHSELRRLRDLLPRQGFRDSSGEIQHLDRLVGELSNFNFGTGNLETIRRIAAKLKDLPKGKEGAARLHQARRDLQRVRNLIVHDVTADTRVRPAYSLGDEDNDG
jgi:transcriptional regulator with XRE-family HTH domain